MSRARPGVNFLMLLGYVCGGWVMGISALKADEIACAGRQ